GDNPRCGGRSGAIRRGRDFTRHPHGNGGPHSPYRIIAPFLPRTSGEHHRSKHGRGTAGGGPIRSGGPGRRPRPFDPPGVPPPIPGGGNGRVCRPDRSIHPKHPTCGSAAPPGRAAPPVGGTPKRRHPALKRYSPAFPPLFLYNGVKSTSPMASTNSEK